MSEVRSAAAMAGCVDEQKLIFDFSREANKSETAEDLHRVWTAYVLAVMDAISNETVDICWKAYKCRLAVIS